MIVEDEEHKTESVTPDTSSQRETQKIELRVCLSDEETQDNKETEQGLSVADTEEDRSRVEGVEQCCLVRLGF